MIVFYALQRLLADYGTVYLIVLCLQVIAVMLFAHRGLWGFFTVRTGIDLFPPRHRPPIAPRQPSPQLPSPQPDPVLRGKRE